MMARNSTATRVLFDEPGPRGRARIRVATILVASLVLLAAAAAVWQFGRQGQLVAYKWAFFTNPAIIRFLAVGVWGTLLATVVSAIFAFPLGLFLALGRLSPNRTVAAICTGWIEFFRAIPMLLVVYAFLLVMPRYGLNLDTMWKLVIPMILVNSANTAEVFRAGIKSVDKGQSEAAMSLGMRHGQAMRLIVLPQAFRIVLPGLLSQLVSLLKDSTLGFVVSYPELMQQGRGLTAYYGYLIQTYLVVALIYVLGNFGVTKLAEYLQQRGTTKAASKATAAVKTAELVTIQ